MLHAYIEGGCGFHSRHRCAHSSIVFVRWLSPHTMAYLRGRGAERGLGERVPSLPAHPTHARARPSKSIFSKECASRSDAASALLLSVQGVCRVRAEQTQSRRRVCGARGLRRGQAPLQVALQ